MNISAFVRLTRLEHALMLCAAVLIGEVIALGGLPDPLFALLSFFPPFFIEISAFAINDYFDIGTDRLNKRMDRPLVSGEAKPGEALFISIASLLIGVAAAYLINLPSFIIALAFGVLSLLYSYKLKDLPLIGNMYVAATMAIPFVFGNLAVSPAMSPAVMSLAYIAFVAGLGREILGTIRDMEGDMAGRRGTTLPTLMGKQCSLILASLLLLIAVLLSAIPFTSVAHFKGNLNYLIPVAITDGLLLYVAVRAFGNSEEFLGQARTITLAALAFGLVGFLLGALT